MVEKGKTLIEIDLNLFKLHVRNANGTGLSLHFNSPSRRFYLSVIALVVSEMKKLGKVISIPLEDHYDTLALLNETIGGKAGSSDKENLLPRIYRKWKDALPDLEHAPLFKVVGRRKEYEDAVGKTYEFTDEEKDSWANLFDYMGSEEKFRPRFSVDKLGATLDQVIIIYGEGPEHFGDYAWGRFIEGLKQEVHDHDLRDKGALAAASSKWAQWRRPTLSGVTGLLLVGVIFAIYYFSFHKPKSVSEGVPSVESSVPLPEKPSIAVLPFVNMSGDPKQEYFSDGITEEIITALSRTPKMLVIARNSTFTYKGKPVKVKQVAEELGVRYVLEGSVRKSEDRVRINAQLIDAIQEEHLWAERYDRDIRDIFALQDEITIKILTGLQVKLTEGAQARMLAKQCGNLDVYLKSMEAVAAWSRGTTEGKILHGQLAQEIIDMAPESAIGYRLLAWNNWVLAMGGRTPRESLAKAFKLAQKALQMDESDSFSNTLLGSVYLYMREYDKAIAAGERAVALNPNGAFDHDMLGNTLNYAGRPDEAMYHLKRAIRLNPFPDYWYFRHLGICYMQKGQYEEALTEFEKALHRSPDAAINHLSLAIIYALLDRQDEARAATKKVLEINPKYSVKAMKRVWPYKNQADLTLVVEAVQKAGLK